MTEFSHSTETGVLVIYVTGIYMKLGSFCQTNQLKVFNIKKQSPQVELYNIFILVHLLEVHPLMHYIQDVVELMHFSSSPESLTCPFPVWSRQL